MNTWLASEGALNLTSTMYTHQLWCSR